VQVLFAFLLIVPFQPGFDRVTELGRGVYFTSLLCAAAGTALLIAPSSYHRLRFRSGVASKEQLLLTSNKLLIAGTVLVAIAMIAVVYLIADVLFGGVASVAVAVAVGAWFAWFWYGLPLSRPEGDDDTAEDESPDTEDGGSDSRGTD
jgi:fatty acid desaturase